MPDQAYKYCPSCKERKPLDKFAKNKRTSDGHHGWCKTCHARKMRELRARDPETARKKDRAHYAANRERKAASARRSRRRRYARNPDHKRDEWYRLSKGVELEWAEVLLRDPCAYCGERPGGEIDHIYPGINGWDNLTGCCRSCNPSKGKKGVLLFLAHQNGCFEWRKDRAA